MAVLTQALRPRARWWTFLAAALLIVFAMAGAWSLLTIFAVENAARATAGQRAYCLQVAEGQFGYRTVERHVELFGFNLLVPATGGGGSEDYKWTFNAVLAVEDGGVALYNWSHMSQAFMPITAEARDLMRLEPVCEPIANFIETLR